jgi:UPF0755 protein
VTDLFAEAAESPSRPTRGHRRKRRRGGRAFAVLFVLALLVALVGGGAYGVSRVLTHFRSAPDYAGPGAGEVVVQVKDGDTATSVAGTLRSVDVIASSAAFLKVANTDPRSTSLQPGFYRMLKQMKARDAFARLLDPAARVQGRVVLPEGLSLAQALVSISQQAKLPLAQVQAAAADTAQLGLPAWANGQLEGFLFPATYEVQPGTTAPTLLAAMVQRFLKAEQDIGLEQRAAELGVSPYDIVRTASLIEKETAYPDDRPKVARVVYNRLRIGMPLQFDSTVNYIREEKKARLSLDDIKVESAYNTYLNKGLPPTPIGSPGEATLDAALQPADGDYVYFVTISKSGQSLFTKDYNEFLRAKAKAQADGVY